MKNQKEFCKRTVLIRNEKERERTSLNKENEREK